MRSLRCWRCPIASSPLAVFPLEARAAASAAARADLAIRLDARRAYWAAAFVLADRDDWARPAAAAVLVAPVCSARPAAAVAPVCSERPVASAVPVAAANLNVAAN